MIDDAAMIARDSRMCTCGHRNVSHGSFAPGHVFVGTGNGPCGIDRDTRNALTGWTGDPCPCQAFTNADTTPETAEESETTVTTMTPERAREIVIEDQRGAMTDEENANTTDAAILAHVRNTVTLPDAPRVPGALPIELDDDSDNADAYRIVLEPKKETDR